MGTLGGMEGRADSGGGGLMMAILTALISCQLGRWSQLSLIRGYLRLKMVLIIFFLRSGQLLLYFPDEDLITYLFLSRKSFIDMQPKVDT